MATKETKEAVPEGTRRNLDKACNTNELYAMMNIQTELGVGKAATLPDSIPEGVSQDRAAAYFAGALQMLAAAQTKEKLWWNAVMAKYELPRDVNVHVDFADGAFYVLDPVKA
jgi:hypothetical protein